MPVVLEVFSPVLRRWNRMVTRLWSRTRWHWHGLMLWLIQRPYLRFTPPPLDPPNLQRAGVESAGSGDGSERQLAEALVAEGQLRSYGLEGRHYPEEADGEQRSLRGRSLRPASLPDDAEEGQARGAEGHRGRDPQVDEGRPSRSRAPTPHTHRTARRFAEASQRVGGAMHVALRRRGRQGYGGEAQEQAGTGDHGHQRRQESQRLDYRPGAQGEERRSRSQSSSVSRRVRALSSRRSSSRSTESGQSISTLRTASTEESEQPSPDDGGLPYGGIGGLPEDGWQPEPSGVSDHGARPDVGDYGRDGGAAGSGDVRPERLRASDQSLKKVDYEVAVATRLSIAGEQGQQLGHVKKGVKIPLRQAAEKTLRLHGVLGASTRKIEEVLEAVYEDEFKEISMGMREAFIGEIQLPEFAQLGRGRPGRQLPARGGLLRFDYESRAPDGLDTLADGYARTIMYLVNDYVFLSIPWGLRSRCIQPLLLVSAGLVLTGRMERWSLRSETTSTPGIDGGFFPSLGVARRGSSCPPSRSRRCTQGLMWKRSFPQSWFDF